jgi:hypothetical protein
MSKQPAVRNDPGLNNRFTLAQYLEIGCRIPHEYFWVIGWGESEVGIETGSYDAALAMAGIENYNVTL